MALAVVYLPMVAGDDRARAVEQVPTLDDPRVATFWDGERALGLACGREYAADHLPMILETLPPDDPFRGLLESRRDDPGPMWDIAFFYAPGARWPEVGLPALSAWAKQFDHFTDDDGRSGGGFFRGTPASAETVWTCWEDEFARGMAAVTE